MPEDKPNGAGRCGQGARSRPVPAEGDAPCAAATTPGLRETPLPAVGAARCLSSQALDQEALLWWLI